MRIEIFANILSAFLVSMGLSMDNFAVSLSAGCSGQTGLTWNNIWRVSLWFALAHFCMFSVGFLGGHEVVRYIGQLGVWIACGILCYIGVRMIYEALHPHPGLRVGVLTSLSARAMLAFATSVDALFVGMGLGLVSSDYWLTVILLSVCVFGTSAVGFYTGQMLGKRFGRMMEMAGGLVLIGMGVKLLL